MSSCQVSRTPWGWEEGLEDGVHCSSQEQWRSPAAIKSVCSLTQVAGCSLQPGAPLAVGDICSPVQHDNPADGLCCLCEGWMVATNMGLHAFLHSSLPLHSLKENRLQNFLFKGKNIPKTCL